jgi:hypothetical protein
MNTIRPGFWALDRAWDNAYLGRILAPPGDPNEGGASIVARIQDSAEAQRIVDRHNAEIRLLADRAE